jgi:hypothetical protein
LPWQQWTETSVWFDDVGISVFHSCVVDLWQSLSKCVFGVLHHDNAPAHTTLSAREFLASKQITVLEHPLYSLDLYPSDFYLFPKVKKILKGRYFDDIDDIRNNTTAAPKASPQNEFQNYFEGWTRRWHRCIASQGEYFGGDYSDIQKWGM